MVSPLFLSSSTASPAGLEDSSSVQADNTGETGEDTFNRIGRDLEKMIKGKDNDRRIGKKKDQVVKKGNGKERFTRNHLDILC